MGCCENCDGVYYNNLLIKQHEFRFPFSNNQNSEGKISFKEKNNKTISKLF